MIDLHLYVPTYYSAVGDTITFNLYVSAQNISPPKPESNYYMSAQTGEVIYNLKYYPVVSTSVTISATYVGNTVILLSSVGTHTYNNNQYVFLTDISVATPSPTAYLNANTGEIIFPITNSTYGAAYTSGATSVYINSGYNVPILFSNTYYTGTMTVDFGDNTSQVYSYAGSPGDSFTHIYSAIDTYTISVTTQILTGSNSYATVTRTFTDALEIAATDDNTDTDVIRINNETIVALPYPSARIPINEWVAEQPINTVFRQLYDNYEYIVDCAQIYQLAPIAYNGWGTVTDVANNRNILNWHIDTYASSTISTSGASTITGIYTLNDDYIYIGKTDRVEKYLHSLGSRETIADTAADSVYEVAGRVNGFAVSSDDKVYILDTRKLLVKVYSYNSTTGDYIPVFEWGGLGGVTGNTKFYKPNQLFIANDKVFVVDSGNNCVKRFTLGGQWEYTYTSASFTTGDIATGAPISATMDDDNNLYVINTDTIVKMSYTGTEIFSLPIQMLISTPVSIHHKKGFIYIATKNNIIRVFTSGESTNIFATRSLVSSAIDEYTNIHVDDTNNIYITDGKIILKYIDAPVLFDAAPRFDDNYWSFDDIKVHRDSFVSSATYNKFFHRLYDNLKTFFHSIESKVVITTNNTLLLTTLETCDLGTFQGLPIDKEDIYIGMNEIVTPEVMNRCINQILILEQYILDVLLNIYSGCNTGDPASFRVPLPELPDCTWTWAARRAALCCLSWNRLNRIGTTWQSVSSCVETT